MAMAYFNYPNSKITFHISDLCSEVMKHRKENQRFELVELGNFIDVLSEAESGELQFASYPDRNDLWLRISLGSSNADRAFVQLFQAILAARYETFGKAHVTDHDC